MMWPPAQKHKYTTDDVESVISLYPEFQNRQIESSFCDNVNVRVSSTQLWRCPTQTVSIYILVLVKFYTLIYA